MAAFQEVDNKKPFDSWMGRIPGRLHADEAAKILGFAKHDIPILVKHKMLTPLGQPSDKSTKYFAAVEVFRCAADPKWLSRATKIVSKQRRG